MPHTTRADEARLAFDKAFPWFDYDRWFWAFDPAEKSHSSYRRPMASATAKGELALFMPNASFEEFATVRQWLIQRFEPAYLAPLLPPYPARPKRNGRKHGGVVEPPTVNGVPEDPGISAKASRGRPGC